ncbi:MAG: hypothetical protein EAZ97_15300 [Bacteroidetes bacterium]|nr:MAG: hypothetical protein EAZ97_15300 [Bacteroidota bacterium]
MKFFVLYIFTSFFMFQFHLLSAQQLEQPKVVKGILDLRNYDFRTQESVSLNGEWEFFYKTLLSEQNFEIKNDKQFIQVPSIWNNYAWNGSKITGNGYASYKMKMLLNHTHVPMAIKFSYMPNAYRVFFNKELIGTNGKVSSKSEESYCEYKAKIFTFYPIKDTLEVVIEVSNYFHRKGGILNAITLGSDAKVFEKKISKIQMDSLIAGALLFMALYHFGLYFIKQKEISVLYFAFFSLITAFKIMMMSETYLSSIFPQITWIVFTTLEYNLLYLQPFLGILFIASLYKNEFHIKVYWFTIIFALVATCIGLFFNLYVNSHFVNIFEYVSILQVLYVISVIIRALINKQKSATAVLVGTTIIFICTVHDTLNSQNFIHTGIYIVPYGIFLFFFSQSVALSQIFAAAFKEIENLSKTLKDYTENLKDKVAEKTAEYQEANEELQQSNEELTQNLELIKTQKKDIEKKNDDITASINYAKRIQTSMLPTIEQIKNSLPESFVFFKPRDIVSGDFYWFQAKKDIIFVAAVDCTGHGVPGAFMSMIGNEILNELVNARHVYSPDLILNQLHIGVKNALRQNENESRDGMDIAICAIHTSTKKLEYAGAMNPFYYIQNFEIKEIKADRKAIGGLQKEEFRIFTKHEISLEEATTFYICTDGFQDQIGGLEKKKFMVKNLRDLLFSMHYLPMDKQYEMLDETFIKWCLTCKQIDDVLIIGIKLDADIWKKWHKKKHH